MASVKDQIRPALLELFQDSLTDAQHLQRVEHSEKYVEDTLTQSSVQTDAKRRVGILRHILY